MLTILRNADVYAPDPLGVRDVLVAYGRIVAVAPDLAAAAGVTREVDLGGRRLVPGLIDAHAHVTGGGGEGGPHTRVPPLLPGAIASAGVTTVVGVLGTDGTTRTVRDLVATTLGLRAQGLGAWCYTGSYQLPVVTLTGSVRDDIVFIDPILGVGELAISDHRSSQPTLDELLRVASDAYVAGLMSGKAGVVHLHLGDGSRGLDLVRRALDTSELPARVFHPTHVNRQPTLLAEAMALAARGLTSDVTAFPVDGEDDPAVTAEAAIGAWLDAGCDASRLTCSSDGGGCLPTFDDDGRLTRMDVGRPGAIAATLQALLATGRALEDVLPIFTTNVAKVLALPRKGTVAEGQDADLVTLDDDGGVVDVMVGGAWWKRDGVTIDRGVFPAGDESR